MRRALAQPTVLITGFEPFGGEEINPSDVIARALDGRTIAGRRVVGRTLPCVFATANAELARALRETKPEVVICLGQAGGRAEITPERVAINVADARIPDQAGAQPIDVPIELAGPTGYWSTLPIKAIVAALRSKGIPATISQTAGTFLCNHVFYGLMHHVRRRRATRAGFIHVPFTLEQAARHASAPGLPIEQMIIGIETAIDVSLTTNGDLHATGGATH
jgi:pyroglutamyl-peptidase